MILFKLFFCRYDNFSEHIGYVVIVLIKYDLTVLIFLDTVNVTSV